MENKHKHKITSNIFLMHKDQISHLKKQIQSLQNRHQTNTNQFKQIKQIKNIKHFKHFQKIKQSTKSKTKHLTFQKITTIKTQNIEHNKTTHAKQTSKIPTTSTT